ncbi:MAG: hypothetical protein SFW08_00590 [Gemmatimonadaceae bacterium]|nr:hypothetical protein [Gemmatimonadaceae bacterium]
MNAIRHLRRPLAAFLFATGGVAASAAPMLGQRILDPHGDASLPKPGQIRLSLGGRWEVFDQTLPATSGGPVRQLGDGLFGNPASSRLDNSTPLLRLLTRDPNITGSPGAVLGGVEARNWAIPIELEVGVSSWLSLHVAVPVQRSFSAFFARPNPPGTTANLGLNPAITSAAARTAVGQLDTQLGSAATALVGSRPDCFPTVGPAPGTCASLFTVLTRTNQMRGLVGQIYRVGAFVPLAGSRADTLIAAEFAALNAALRAALGLTSDPVTARPVQAAARMGLNDLQTLVLALGLDSLGSIKRITAGDGGAGFTLKVFDSFGASDSARMRGTGLRLRSAVKVTARAGLGHAAGPTLWTDQGTGSNALSADVRWFTDVQFSPRYWGTVLVRRVQYGSETMSLLSQFTTADGPVFGARSPVPGTTADQPPTDLQRTRGATTQIELTPRVVLNDYISLAGSWAWRSRGDDRFSISGTACAVCLSQSPTGDPLPVGLDGVLAVGGQEQRVGIGLTYSTAAAKRPNRRGVPMEISYLHQQVVSGTNLPKLSLDALQMRFYWPLKPR